MSNSGKHRIISGNKYDIKIAHGTTTIHERRWSFARTQGMIGVIIFFFLNCLATLLINIEMKFDVRVLLVTFVTFGDFIIAWYLNATRRNYTRHDGYIYIVCLLILPSGLGMLTGWWLIAPHMDRALSLLVAAIYWGMRLCFELLFTRQDEDTMV